MNAFMFIWGTLKRNSYSLTHPFILSCICMIIQIIKKHGPSFGSNAEADDDDVTDAAAVNDHYDDNDVVIGCFIS